MQQLPIMTIISICTLNTLKEAAKSLKQGNLVAFPTETVYGLGADATNEDAVARIYDVKGRPTGHPLIVHISSMNNLDKWARDIPDYAIILARAFWPGPMTLILPRTGLAKDFITGSQANIGIRVPAHPLALSLLQEFEALGGFGVAAPSANRFGKVSPTNVEAVMAELSDKLGINDLILDGGQSQIGLESTIIDCTNQIPRILRPGAVDSLMINSVIAGLMFQNNKYDNSNNIKTSGQLETHYAPLAQVFLNGEPKSGDGFIALSKFTTPSGAIRLASPQNNVEFAKLLYSTLRKADNDKIDKVFVIPPEGEGIAHAIRDRLQKCSTRES